MTYIRCHYPGRLLLVATDNAGGCRCRNTACGAVGDVGVFHLDIACPGVRCHFTGQQCQVLLVCVHGSIGQAQVTNFGVRLQISEQAVIQIADGVTATIVVSPE